MKKYSRGELTKNILKFIGEYFGISKHIIFLETRKINNEDSLKDEFEL
ncbi:hypothetical protein KJ991_00490 [Patescibacteria group bacterium]|nr:hypothetical protein [Patescibacteria group bacterium]MBU4116005.1 hypothetical protein [Patescibacteria group bacterium]